MGYVSNNIDCDGTRTTVHPRITEVCNGIGDDCDWLIDEGVRITGQIAVIEITINIFVPIIN